MSTWINVARLHLVDRITYLAGPWAILAFCFAATLVIFAAAGGGPQAPHQGALVAIYVVFFVLGLLSIVRSLPFALALGVSRRSYYTGTVLLAVGLAAVYGLALALLQVIERQTGGWAVSLYFFRVSYILDGPWYLTWLTSFVVLTLMFVYGMWFGLVYRRWDLLGTWAFGAAQASLLVAGVVVVTRAQAWPAIGHLFTTVSAVGLTGLLAGLAVVLLAGGLATVRRVTV